MDEREILKRNLETFRANLRPEKDQDVLFSFIDIVSKENTVTLHKQISILLDFLSRNAASKRQYLELEYRLLLPSEIYREMICYSNMRGYTPPQRGDKVYEKIQDYNAYVKKKLEVMMTKVKKSDEVLIALVLFSEKKRFSFFSSKNVIPHRVANDNNLPKKDTKFFK